MKKLSKEEMDKVIKESYKTLISIKSKNQGGPPNSDEADERKENLKKKYAKFTS